jgi:hypothetical protein
MKYLIIIYLIFNLQHFGRSLSKEEYHDDDVYEYYEFNQNQNEFIGDEHHLNYDFIVNVNSYF